MSNTVAAPAPLTARLRPFTGVLALALLATVFGLLSPRFLSVENFFNIFDGVAIVGILALGQAFPLIGGGFDLSQGAIAGLTGAITASLMSRYGLPIPAAITAGLGVGGALGWMNGILIARAKINPFVATLGTQTAFQGVTFVYTNNQPQSLGPQADAFKQIAQGSVGGFSHPALLFLALALLAAFVLRLLPFGQHVYTLGGNEEATRLAGINTVRLKISTYVLSGLLSAVAAVVMIARAGQASPVEGQRMELESIASCIVGGIALGGGVGGAWNVVLGALTLGVIGVGLQMSGGKTYSLMGQPFQITPYWQWVIRGVVILLAVALDARTRRQRG